MKPTYISISFPVTISTEYVTKERQEKINRLKTSPEDYELAEEIKEELYAIADLYLTDGVQPIIVSVSDSALESLVD